MNAAANLKLLLDEAERQRDLARRHAQHAQAQHDRARQQHEQLGAYRSGYEQRWTDTFRQSGGRELLDARHQFGQRLDEAIDHQAREASGLHDRLERARAALLERERRVAAVRKLIERRVAVERAAADRREQRAIDEFASQALLRQRSAAAEDGDGASL